MKVRNIMFSGFAAAILMGTANAAVPFQIASKAYVDPEADGQYIRTAATTGANLTALDNAIKNAATSADTIGDLDNLNNGENTNFDGENATVVDALNDLDNALNTKQDKSASEVTTAGNHLTAGNGVGANLEALDEALGAVETKVGETSVADQIDNKLGELGTNEATGAENTVADALAGKVDKSAVATSIGSKDNASNDKWASEKAVAEAIAGVTGDIGSIQQQIDEVVGDLGQNATTGKENTVEQALATKQDKSDSNVTTAGTYIQTGTGVAANLGRLDTAAKDAKDAADAAQADVDALETTVNGNGDDDTGLVGDVAELQNALNGENGLDGRVSALEETVGDATDGLVKDVADLQTNKANVADVYTRTEMDSLLGAKLDKPVPNSCTAQSKHCVLHMEMVNNEPQLSWVDVTNPWSVEEETQTEP